MKLRNLLATAALLFTATAAFAGHSIDTNTYDIDDFLWIKPATAQSVHVTLTKDGQEGFQYAVYDAAYYNTFKDDKKLFKNIGSEAYAGKIWLLQEGDNEIALPAGVTELGVVSSNPHTTFSGDNATEKFLFYRTKATISNNMVSYGKLDDKGGGNHAADVAFGAPLPTPVVTLLIALGFGAALVMYRRKQAKA